MRTRRSPRNQEILWRLLGGEKKVILPPTIDEQIVATEAALKTCWNKRTRGQLERDLARLKVRRAQKSE